MTQADAKNAVKRIRINLEKALQESKADLVFPRFNDVLSDIEDLEAQLNERKQATPNCRPVTAAELQQLCTASNVVTFQPAA